MFVVLTALVPPLRRVMRKTGVENRRTFHETRSRVRVSAAAARRAVLSDVASLAVAQRRSVGHHTVGVARAVLVGEDWNGKHAWSNSR